MSKRIKFFGLSLRELPRQVRAEVRKPLHVKLKKARQLLKLYAHTKAYVSCSFGKDSMVVLFLALQERKDIPVVLCNTGIDYKETLRFKDRIVKEWDLNYVELHPETTYFKVMDRVKAQGKKLDDGSKKSNVCCYHLKEKPFRKFTRANDFLINFTGVTAQESRKRAWVACQKGQEYFVRSQSITKVHPILYWQPHEVENFIEEMGIPRNPVYEKYDLVRTGCICCTCYRGWREVLSRTHPKLYKMIMSRYFDQVTF